jgi:DNA-binding Lrp family transcriptional regulator
LSESEFLVRDSRLARHFWADNEVVDIFGAQLGAHAFAVYMVLCRHAINHTGEVRISSRKIARQVGMSPQGVLNALDHLGRLGLVRHAQAPTRSEGGLYLLADVKAMLDPEYAQLKLVGRVTHGVNPVDTSSRKGVNAVDTGVHTVDAAVNQVDTVSRGWTRNKEDKTSSRLKTNKTVSLSPQLSERIEKERRQNLTEATRRGMRDFEKHPREDWELH